MTQCEFWKITITIFLQKFSVINAWNTNPDCLWCMLLTLFLGFFFKEIMYGNSLPHIFDKNFVKSTYFTREITNELISRNIFFSVIISETCLPTLQFFREIALQYDSNLADLTKFLLNWSYSESDATLFWQKFRKSTAITKKLLNSWFDGEKIWWE